MQKDKVYLVGIKDPASPTEVKYIKAFANPKWAARYAKAAGVYAAFADIDMSTLVFTDQPTEAIKKAM